MSLFPIMFERMTETRSGWQTQRLARTARYVAQVDSTQAEARRLCLEGAPDGTIVMAGEQTAGRGRLGRAWQSPPGNLYVSLLLRPSLPLPEWPQCTMAAALAIAGALDALAVRGVALKWPNDVLINGCKVAGILAEAMDTSLIVGFGVNANAELPPELGEATSVTRVCERRIELDGLLDGILTRFDVSYAALLYGQRLTTAWAARLQTLGRAVQVTSGSRVVCGVAEAVADDGALLVRTDAGVLERFHAADVTLRREVEA